MIGVPLLTFHSKIHVESKRQSELSLSTAVLALAPPSTTKVSHTYKVVGSGNIKGDDLNAKLQKRSKSADLEKKTTGVPSYAVSMEPLVKYSQPDPLFNQEKLPNGKAKKSGLIRVKKENNDIGNVDYSQKLTPKTGYAYPYSGFDAGAEQPRSDYAGHGGYYDHYEEPEPIIEIIIKESNQSLPAPPPPPPPKKKKKEPVQVFYVKYKKEPSSHYGEEKVVYEPPVPAITPPTNNDNAEEEEVEDYHHHHHHEEPVTLPPRPSTTLKAIIRPDSETYHGTGIHITFGGPKDEETSHDDDHHSHGGYEDQSAPQPAVALPPTAKADTNVKLSTASQLKKRNPAPFHSQTPPPQQSFHNGPQFPGNGDFYRPTPGPVFQQSPRFSAQPNPFPPSLSPSPSSPAPQQNPPRQGSSLSYSTLPQLQSFPKPQSSFSFPQSRPQQPPQSLQHLAQHVSHTQQLFSINQPHLKSSFSINSRSTPQPYHTISNRVTQHNFQKPPQPVPVNPSVPPFQQSQKTFSQQGHTFSKPVHQFPQPSSFPRPTPSAFPQPTPNTFPQPTSNSFPQGSHSFQQPTFSHSQNTLRHEQRAQNSQPPPPQSVSSQHHIKYQQQQHHQQQPQQQHRFQQQFDQLNQQHQQNQLEQLHQQHRQQLEELQQHQRQQQLEQFNQQRHNFGQNQQQQHQQFGQHVNQQQQQQRQQFSQQVNQQRQQFSQQINQQRQQFSQQLGQQQQQYENLGQIQHNQQTEQFNHLQRQQQTEKFQRTQSELTQNFQKQTQQTTDPTYAPEIIKSISADFPLSGHRFDARTQLTSTSSPQYVQNVHTSSNPQYVQNVHTSSRQQFVQNVQPTNRPQFVQNVQTTTRPQFVQNVQTTTRPQFIQNSQPTTRAQFVHGAQSNNQRYTPSKSVVSTTEAYKKFTETTQPPIEYITPDPKQAEEERRKKEERKKQNVAALPAEVPEDLRKQLLSSDILGNADIQILDYDKIGDIPIDKLPPEALANFQAVAGSAPVPSVVKPDSPPDDDAVAEGSEQQAVAVPPPGGVMEMKVVRYNPDSKEGSQVAHQYMKEGATQLEPVVLNDSRYNRYLPLKVAGAQFPVPDVPELRGKNVTSVVVLAPVDYEFLQRHEEEDGRSGRSSHPVLEVQGVHFVTGDILKTLVKRPTLENYRLWLEKEKNTAVDKQSVVLLVIDSKNNETSQPKEIYMYDISTRNVNKLSGELSAQFVEVAESNSENDDLDEISENRPGSFTVKDTAEVASSEVRKTPENAEKTGKPTAR
ncbi:hypothetical protein RUM44_011129 [Polyplax serrata]|uniref:Uncharacterized protein n=1 Tax=Polyplax serrata TaxID=468196 RepID=A0ABR1AP54_POLSC